MQQGQQPAGLMPGGAGFTMTPSMQAFLGQTGQIQGMQGHAILAQRLAVLPPGARGGLPAANQSYRAAAPQMQMGVMIKPPNRKTSASVKGRKSCNCKNSKCLKLYCECFASGRYCDNCNCLSCFNNKESEAVRQAAVESILERNPNAFRPKIQTAEGDTHPQSIRNAPDGSVRHTKGCNCKKSSCLKKYCECFQGGISCTEICKCVDCKNFDGSEARAQVISHHGDPFSMHSAAVAAAQQQALKRPRLQLQQAPLMQTQAGLQASIMQQQLAAAVSGGQAAAALQPLQQLQALTAAGLGLPAPASLPQVSAAPLAALPAGGGAVGAAAGGSGGLTPAGSTAAAALQQLPTRPHMLDAVHELVKPEVLDDLCSLLVIVAQEQADKSKQQEQDQQQQQQEQPGSGAAEAADGGAAGGIADGDAAQCNGLKRKRSDSEAADEDGSGAKRAALGDGIAAEGQEGADAMHEALQQQQQDAAVGLAGVNGVTDLYISQEGVVLTEFNAILQRILTSADKKASGAAAEAAEAAAAAAAAAAEADTAAMDHAAAAAAAAGVASLYDGLGDAADPQQQLLQQMAEQLQQQQDQLQQQDIKPLGRPPLLSQQQQQQQALATQQALLMQAAAANGNLALLQASRGLYLQTAQQQQQLMQPLMMQAAGLGMQGLGALRPNAVQMVPVVAQDGTVHQVPAHALMTLQLAASQGLQQQGQQLGTGAGAAAAAAAAGAQQAAPASAAVSAPVPAAPQVSLLSLLNGTGTTSGNSS